MPRILYGFMLSGLLLLGCSGSGGSTDSSVEDAVDGAGDPGSDPGSDPGAADYMGDIDLGDNYAFIVPGPTDLCGVYREGRSITEEYNLLCRISLSPGVHLLPTDQRSFPLTFVDAVEFGPSRIAGVGQGQGSCQYQPQGNSHTYECDQTFMVDSIPLRINYRITFPYQDGDRIVFEPAYTYYPMMEGFLGAGQDYNTEQPQFSSCHISQLGTYRITFDWQNGDQTVLDQPCWNSPLFFPGYVGETSPANIERALVTVGGNQREVTEYFQLVYAARHHNWFEEYLVILDPPEGEVHGLYCIDSGDMGMGAPEELLYLGADLDPGNPLSRTPLSEYQMEHLP